MLDRLIHFSDRSPRLDTCRRWFPGDYSFILFEKVVVTLLPDVSLRYVIRYIYGILHVSFFCYFAIWTAYDDNLKSQFIMNINEIEW